MFKTTQFVLTWATLLCCFQTVFCNLQLFRNCIEESGLPSDSLIERNTNSSIYNDLNYQWNLRKPYVYPLAYFVPLKTEDVQRAVWCGLKANIPLIPKSGGHSYESYGFGSSDTLIIDFRKMEQVEVDPIKKIATVQPGVLLGPLYLKLWKNGGFGIPMGNCLSVGLGGHALGGGIGLFSHMFGLALDNIVEYTMVDAKGFSQTVNAVQNPDLFWALRGVGSGYLGIVTSFKFKLFEASRLKFTFVILRYELDQAAVVLEAWQKWLAWTEKNDTKIFSNLFFTGSSYTSTNTGRFAPIGTKIEFHGIHIQDDKIQPNGNATFLKMLREILPPTKSWTEIFPSYYDIVTHTGYAPVVSSKSRFETDIGSLRNYLALPRYFKEKSFYVDKEFDANALAPVADAFRRIPDRNVWVMMLAEGGVLHNPAPNAMAYVHRKSMYSIALHYEGADDTKSVTEGLTWVYDFMKTAEFMDNGQTYQNYVDSDLKDYLKRYYGSNLPKLVHTKKNWDPQNYFKNPMSLPLSI